jgi:hypothetical protein
MAQTQLTLTFPNPAMESLDGPIALPKAWTNKTTHETMERPFSKFPNPTNEPTECYLYEALTEAAKETDIDWPHAFDWKQTRNLTITVVLGFLLFATLVGFAIACWEILGYVGAVALSLMVYLG